MHVNEMAFPIDIFYIPSIQLYVTRQQNISNVNLTDNCFSLKMMIIIYVYISEGVQSY